MAIRSAVLGVRIGPGGATTSSRSTPRARALARAAVTCRIATSSDSAGSSRNSSIPPLALYFRLRARR